MAEASGRRSRPGARRPTAAARGPGTPLHRKLGVRPGHVVVLVRSPPGWQIPDLPEGVSVRRSSSTRPSRPVAGDRRSTAGPDVVVAFFRSAADVEGAAPVWARSLAPGSALWAAWPRRAGGHDSDVTESLLRSALLPVGVVDVKVAALDDDWSGLKFVWRRDRTLPATPI